MKLGSDFSWLWVAIIRIFTAPFYIVLLFEAPKGAVSFFPYPHIEATIMIVLTLLVATVRTIYREEFDEL